VQVIGGSLLMTLGVGAIALSSATNKEQSRWKDAAQQESDRYGVAAEYVEARMDGRQAAGEAPPKRRAVDWILIAGATAVFAGFARIARVPQLSIHWGPAVILIAAMLILLVACGMAIWKTTKFN
jgi:hypothetical protein